MDAIPQTTFSNALSWMKTHGFRLKFHRILLLRVDLNQQWFKRWFGADQATSHYPNQWWLVYRRINVSLGLNGNSLQWRLMSVMASQITSNSIVCSIACSGWHDGTHQSSTLMALGPHKWSVIRKAFAFHGVGGQVDSSLRGASSADVVSISWPHCVLTLKRLGHFFQNVILFSNVVQPKCNIFIWKCSNKLIV